MIRIVIVDDHPALRAGLETVVAAEPDLAVVGAADSGESLWPLLHTTRPDVVLLDYHLPGADGLQLCRRIKADALPPRVLLYSAYAGGELAIPAILAGADGVVGKGIPARELLEATRVVASGKRILPPVPQELYERAAQRLESADLPIMGMMLDGTPLPDVQSILGADRAAIAHRLDRMIGQLRVDVPTPSRADG